MSSLASTSWQISFDEPQPLVIGLFVRDVAGLRSRHAWLPHCAPAVLPSDVEGSDEAAELLRDADEYRRLMSPVLRALL